MFEVPSCCVQSLGHLLGLQGIIWQREAGYTEDIYEHIKFQVRLWDLSEVH